MGYGIYGERGLFSILFLKEVCGQFGSVEDYVCLLLCKYNTVVNYILS